MFDKPRFFVALIVFLFMFNNTHSLIDLSNEPQQKYETPLSFSCQSLSVTIIRYSPNYGTINLQGTLELYNIFIEQGLKSAGSFQKIIFSVFTQITDSFSSNLYFAELEKLISSNFLICFANIIQEINLSLSSRKESSKAKQMIKEVIYNNPGINFRGIHRVTGLAFGNIQYHLYNLQKANVINSFSLGCSKHFFYNHNHFSEEEKLIYSLCLNENIYTILQFLSESQCVVQREIIIAAGLNKSLVSYYMNKLQKKGIISRLDGSLTVSPEFKVILTAYFE